MMFWLALDVIQHHMILEKCYCHYQIFLSFVDEAPVVPGCMEKE